MSFVIMTDSASNLAGAVAKSCGITVIPMSYIVDGTAHTCEDMEKFDQADYYSTLTTSTVTTSQIAPAQYIANMEPILAGGQDILFITLSSGISGSYNSAMIAREELLEQYPERQIMVVDSLGASLGEGILALRAAKCRDHDMTLDETAERLERLKKRICQVFVVDDLAHLRRTGRLSGLGAMIGTALGIKPMLKGDSTGHIVMTGKVRGRKGAIKALADKCVELIEDARFVGIAYGGCLEDAKALIEQIKSRVNISELMLVKHEPVTASHLGPGSLALFFEGAEDVREC